MKSPAKLIGLLAMLIAMCACPATAQYGYSRGGGGYSSGYRSGGYTGGGGYRSGGYVNRPSYQAPRASAPAYRTASPRPFSQPYRSPSAVPGAGYRSQTVSRPINSTSRPNTGATYRPNSATGSPRPAAWTTLPQSTVGNGGRAGQGDAYPANFRPTTARLQSTVVSGSANQRGSGPAGVAPTDPTFSNTARVTGYTPGRPGVSRATPVLTPVVTHPAQNLGAIGYRNTAHPEFYSNVDCRRDARFHHPGFFGPGFSGPGLFGPGFFQPGVFQPAFLSLGFFATRPYEVFDPSVISYDQPFVYGDEQYYRSALPASEAVASTQPVAPPSIETELLTELASYVQSHSQSGRFRIVDPALENRVWSLDLTQAPAVYHIEADHYSVVSGFEGALAESKVPSSVGLEFFMTRENGRWQVKNAWIISANGIPRLKRFQSPVFPQVQTWQSGQNCPFSGQLMVPIVEQKAQTE